MWIWLLVLTLAGLLAIAGIVLVLMRARTQALAIRPAGAPGDDEGVSLAAMIRELRPSFADSLHRLRKAVRGVDFRYGVPWYLLIGPPDAGKSSLVADAHESATLGPEAAGSRRTAASLAWHYFDGGVVIDVAAALALPRRGGDAGGWRALLHLLKRHRPRRPVDGLLLAVPASLLLDEQWKARAHDLGAVVRERIVVAQAAFGFALPVYVVITQSDRITGFGAFAGALPDNQQQGMIGWSNPHDPDMLFQGDWIGEGFDELHRGIVRVQVELFATTQNPDQSSSLFLFSGELRRLTDPLRHLLEEIFRPNAYRAAAFFRGFYLTGQLPARTDTAAPRVGFFRDLLDSKVFPERGLAVPLSGATVARNRVSRAALAAACALALILGIGTYGAYNRLLGVRAAYGGFLDDVEGALDLRAKSASGERSVSVDDRIEGGYHLLEQVVSLSAMRLQSIFLPASWLNSIEPAIGGVIMAVFGELILPDFAVGLEAKGATLFDWTPESIPDEDSRGLSPKLADSERYRALETFAADYRLYVDNYFRYYTLREAGEGDLRELAALGNYLTGRTSMTPQSVPDEPYGRALRAARVTAPLDCSGFDGRVEQKARLLLTAFGTSWFGDENPVKVSGDRFVERWQELLSSEADLVDVVDELDTLGQGVATWASIGAGDALTLPVLEREPFTPLDSPALNECPALKPSLRDAIARVNAQRVGLVDTLTGVEVEPFGPLLVRGEQGLQLGADLQVFKTSLDELKTREFRTMTAVVEEEPTLPARATWRPDDLDRAVQAFEGFDRYRGESFADLAPEFRRPVIAALTTHVARTMATRLAFDAAQGEPLPSEPAALLERIEQLGPRLTKIGRLLPLLEDGDEPFARELITEMDTQAEEALEQLERDASSHHPYLFTRQSDAVLDAWAETQAESAAPADSLKRWTVYVDEQRESIRQYAMQARPLVDFLDLTNVASPIERRWAGLIVDVDGFDQKLAGNGLMALDTFLREGVPTIAPERDCVPGAGVARVRAAGSYLVAVRTDLLEHAVARCRALARSTLESRYAAIARAFNGTLAGRFPFSDVVDAPREASPADVVEFLRVVDRQDGRALAQQAGPRACAESAVEFLRQVDAVYPLLASARELKASGVALDLMPEFRVNRDAEIGGNQIAEWQMEVGRTVFRDGAAAKPARWTSGDPVRLLLRFARDSPSRPVRTADRSRRVLDRTAQFEFQGAWGLLALLHAGRPAPAEVVGARDAGPQTLRLEIPVERDPGRPQLAPVAPAAETFRVYMRLQLFQAGKPDPIVIDRLPVQAPADLGCPLT